MHSNMKLFRANTLPLLIIMLVLAGSVNAFKGHTCDATFFSSLVQLIPCRTSVSPFSPLPPSEACCTALKLLGQPCLCVLINGPSISGVDRKLAMLLPDKCLVKFDPCAIGK